MGWSFPADALEAKKLKEIRLERARSAEDDPDAMCLPVGGEHDAALAGQDNAVDLY